MQKEILARRQQFINKMQLNSAAIFFAAPEQTRSNDTCYPYRQNSDFWYLTGFNEPEAALLLIKSESGVKSILFNRVKDPLAETWTGYRLGQQAAVDTLCVDQAYPFDQITTVLPQHLNHLDAIYHADQQFDFADQILDCVLEILRKGLRQGYVAPTTIIDWRPTLHEMRLFKSPKEIEIMREAGKISAQGHIRAMKSCRVGQFEYHLEAEILHEFAKHGARFPSYNTIVGGGNNGCILHYENNSEQLKNNELVLIDAGCEYQHYAGDITRTFPVNGKFTPAQRQIYDIVLKSLYYALDNLKAGTSIKQVNDQVIRIMLEGLTKLGIVTGNLDTLVAEKAYLPFYMHGLGHWLGLDVHDVGDYKTATRDRMLEPGMVLTVEPGLYINKDADVPPQYRGIGIRIEDNILITQTGNDIFTADVPKDPSEIEKLMAH
nr:Xaa-Pro aminopeptidase [Zophobihabitans entericus]